MRVNQQEEIKIGNLLDSSIITFCQGRNSRKNHMQPESVRQGSNTPRPWPRPRLLEVGGVVVVIIVIADVDVVNVGAVAARSAFATDVGNGNGGGADVVDEVGEDFGRLSSQA